MTKVWHMKTWNWRFWCFSHIKYYTQRSDNVASNDSVFLLSFHVSLLTLLTSDIDQWPEFGNKWLILPVITVNHMYHAFFSSAKQILSLCVVLPAPCRHALHTAPYNRAIVWSSQLNLHNKLSNKSVMRWCRTIQISHVTLACDA